MVNKDLFCVGILIGIPILVLPYTINAYLIMGLNNIPLCIG